MFENVNALIYVLVLGLLAFHIGHRIAGENVAYSEFVFWRNSWVAVTVAAFLGGNFYIYATVASLICLHAHSTRRATVGLYLVLLFSVPLVEIPISGMGVINNLFVVNNPRLLAIILLCPILLDKSKTGRRAGGPLTLSDWLIVGYVTLTVALGSQQYSFTAVLRAAVVQSLDVLVPYFAFSRSVTSVSDLRKAYLAFIVAVLPLSLIAPLEVLKGWHLYGAVAENWGGSLGFTRRDGILRATTIAMNSITLGVMIMVAVGCFIGFLQRSTRSHRLYGFAVFTIFGAGLIATLSRGPWTGTMVLVLAYLVISPNPGTNIGKLCLILAVMCVPLSLTHVGEQIVAFLPFIGSIEGGSAPYREHLIENALIVIGRHPWIGSVNYLSAPEMQEMITGEGIVDIVNTYLEIALYSGLLGLGLFVSSFATVLSNLWRIKKARLPTVEGNELWIFTRASIATLLAIILAIGTVSSIEFIPYTYWSFTGLCVGLIRVTDRQRIMLRMRPLMCRP